MGKTKKHLYEIDFMRACIIFGVLVVHVTSFYNTFEPNFTRRNLFYEGLLSSFHFTRESFMFITGIVLFITYCRKDVFQSRSFWKKRFLLIAIPYIGWNTLYMLFMKSYVPGFTWSSFLPKLGMGLLTGNEFYMYFLVVSMQLYLFFPLMLKAIKKIKKGHWWIFAGSFVLQLGLMAFNQYYLQNIPLSHVPVWIRWLDQYRDRFILTYQFWFVAGALLAVHYEQAKAFVVRHARMVFTIFLIMLALLLVHAGYDRMILRESDGMTTLVLQPIMVPYALMVTVVLWLVGIKWSEAREQNKKISKVITFFGNASFGIFLIQPFTLHYDDDFIYAYHMSLTAHLFLLPLSIVGVYLVSAALSWMIGKIPVLSYIVGKKVGIKRKRDYSGLLKGYSVIK
ncbi:acyltransferase [Alicyclobacillus fastidiosus]|uniref:Acyltransferase n=1 Tax=Alicyclobacillus fastidiosus TaxID=392011 RepID=A0ABV5AHT6_9BACL|nr:acyltransferase [Alicyclobacillus fastidiosus]WEH11578.1 acyltransferase [Alicyclobacillus fastidiosus]